MASTMGKDEFLNWCSTREDRLADIAEITSRAIPTAERGELQRAILGAINAHMRMLAELRRMTDPSARTPNAFAAPVDPQTVDAADAELCTRARALPAEPPRR
jgi:hypothetical protein